MLHIYEPKLRAIQTGDGRLLRVPADVLLRATAGEELEAVKLHFAERGEIAPSDEVGQFLPVLAA